MINLWISISRAVKFQKSLFINLKREEGFGMSELLGIAAALIIAAFVIIPGLTHFAQSVMTGLTSWWTGTIDDVIFSTSAP